MTTPKTVLYADTGKFKGDPGNFFDVETAEKLYNDLQTTTATEAPKATFFQKYVMDPLANSSWFSWGADVLNAISFGYATTSLQDLRRFNIEKYNKLSDIETALESKLSNELKQYNSMARTFAKTSSNNDELYVQFKSDNFKIPNKSLEGVEGIYHKGDDDHPEILEKITKHYYKIQTDDISFEITKPVKDESNKITPHADKVYEAMVTRLQDFEKQTKDLSALQNLYKYSSTHQVAYNFMKNYVLGISNSNLIPE